MEEKINDIIERVIGLNPSSYNNESNFVEDLGCDSLDMFELIVECERVFDISIPNEAIDSLKTVQNLIDYIKEHAA